MLDFHREPASAAVLGGGEGGGRGGSARVVAQPGEDVLAVGFLSTPTLRLAAATKVEVARMQIGSLFLSLFRAAFLSQLSFRAHISSSATF